MKIDHLLKNHGLGAHSKEKAESKGYHHDDAYGVKIDMNNGNPERCVEYINKAEGFVPASIQNGVINMGSWGNIFPFNQIRPCLMKDGAVVTYLNPNDYSKDIAGNNVDITTSSDGDVMIEIPLFLTSVHKVKNQLFVRIKGGSNIGNSYEATGFREGAAWKDYVYISAYPATVKDGKMRSVSNAYPKTDITILNAVRLMEGKGDGYKSILAGQATMLQVLYVILFKRLDSQNAIGRGITDGTMRESGLLDQSGMFYGAQDASKGIKFLGIENIFGNVSTFVDGIRFSSNGGISIHSQGSTINGQYYAGGSRLQGHGKDGYVSKFDNSFLPTEFKGSTSMFTTDYASRKNAAQGYLWGGSSGDGSAAGLFHMNFDIKIENLYPEEAGFRFIYL